jgi:UDP-N-acetylglucosamine 4,6-dehydratase
MFYAGRNGTKFSSIRFGNFWGSRGSIVPKFQQLKRDGAEYLPIHDLRMTRFFLMPEEAADRTLEAVKTMRGGEILCPKMESRKIVDVARMVAPDLRIKEIGAKRGEKIHEEMMTSVEIAITKEIRNFYVIDPHGNGAGKPVSKNFRYRSDENIYSC